jgi:hypothetical protein
MSGAVAASLLSPFCRLVLAPSVDPCPPAVFCAADETEIRQALAHSGGAQRADVVLALDGDLAAAIRQVRRGGAIGSYGPRLSRPAIVTMVQREIELLVPRDLVEAFGRLDLERLRVFDEERVR